MFAWFGYFCCGIKFYVCLFGGKEFKVGQVGEGKDLEDLEEGKNMVKIYSYLKIVLNNEEYNDDNDKKEKRTSHIQISNHIFR